MSRDLNTNRLISELLFTGSELTESELKRVYRGLCKKTHPDLTGKDGSEFSKVHEEYQDAKRYISRLDRFFGPGKAKLPKGRLDPGQALFISLLHYTASGLHSTRVRLKPALKARNRHVIERVIRWAEIYDPSFIPVFIAYNKSWLIRFTDRETRIRLKRAKQLFIKGLNFFFDYKLRGNAVAEKLCLSYLKEACFEFLSLDHKQVRESFIDFSRWLLKEILNADKSR